MPSTSTKFAPKKTVVRAPKTSKAQAADDKPFIDPIVEEAMASYQAAQDKVLSLLGAPTATRVIVAAVAGLVTYASTVWFAIPMMEFIVTGAVSLTGFAFIGFLASVLGWFAVGFSAAYAGIKTYQAVVDFDMNEAKQLGRSVREATAKRVSLVRGWFKRGASSQDAEIVGAC